MVKSATNLFYTNKTPMPKFYGVTSHLLEFPQSNFGGTRKLQFVCKIKIQKIFFCPPPPSFPKKLVVDM